MGGRVRAAAGSSRSRRGIGARPGKSLSPPGGGRSDSDRDRIQEGEEARSELDQQRRRTTSRRELSRHQRFEDVSPQVGVLDQASMDQALSEDADEALSLLADLSGATDVRLRELARRLAGRLVVDLARAGQPRGRGVGRLTSRPADRAEGDLDLEASLDALVAAGAAAGSGPSAWEADGRHRRRTAPPRPEDLLVRTWGRHETALCLVVDRSGSMGGERLAAAAVAAAACAWRAPADWSLLAFSEKVLVLKAQQQDRPADLVVDDVLTLRGFGPTDLSLALRAAGAQLAGARAGRRLTVLLSDCRPTAGEDPAIAAGALDELAIVAPAGDSDDAAELARRIGARWVPLAGPSAIPAAFAELLDR